MKGEIIGYRLIPLYEDDFTGWQPQAFTDCFVTGDCISAFGGETNCISAPVYNQLRYDEEVRAVINEAILR